MSKRWSRIELANHRRTNYNQAMQDFIDGKISKDVLDKRLSKLKQYGRIDS